MEQINALYKQLDDGEINTDTFLKQYNIILKSTFTDPLKALSEQANKIQENINEIDGSCYSCDICPICGDSSSAYCECNGYRGTDKLRSQLSNIRTQRDNLQRQYDTFDKSLDLPRYITILEKRATVLDEPFMRFLFQQKDKLTRAQQIIRDEKDRKIRALTNLILNLQSDIALLNQDQIRKENELLNAKQQYEELIK
jgi:hypothetical protein